MRQPILLLLCSTIILSSCWDFGRRPPKAPYKVWGYKPVFSQDPSFLLVANDAPRQMKNPGKIYVKDNYIFQNDLGYGIHVMDNSDPANPQKVGFIRVNGSSEISIKGNYMYVNSYTSLVVLDVSNWQQVTEVKRIPNAFQQGSSAGYAYYYFIPPPEHGVYFECSGMYAPGVIQTGWVRDSIYNSNCYYP